MEDCVLTFDGAVFNPHAMTRDVESALIKEKSRICIRNRYFFQGPFHLRAESACLVHASLHALTAIDPAYIYLFRATTKLEK